MPSTLFGPNETRRPRRRNNEQGIQIEFAVCVRIFCLSLAARSLANDRGGGSRRCASTSPTSARLVHAAAAAAASPSQARAWALLEISSNSIKSAVAAQQLLCAWPPHCRQPSPLASAAKSHETAEGIQSLAHALPPDADRKRGASRSARAAGRAHVRLASDFWLARNQLKSGSLVVVVLLSLRANTVVVPRASGAMSASC